jgi:hypothetical protein
MNDGVAAGVETLRSAGGKSQPDVVLLVKALDRDMGSEVIRFVDRHRLPRTTVNFVKEFEQRFNVEMKPGRGARTITGAADDFGLRREQSDLPHTIDQLIVTSQGGKDVDGIDRAGDTVT